MAQIASELCHRAQPRTSGSRPQTSPQRKTRAVARARIAATALKTTYGKHKNKLLPLTGSQFKRSDDLATTVDRSNRSPPRNLIPVALQVPSDAEYSPLSDAEPTNQSRNPPSLASGGRDSPTGYPKQPQSAQLNQRKAKPRATRVSKGRLPLNQLILVAGNGSDTHTGQLTREGTLSRKAKRAAARDPASSAARTLLDASISSDSDATPTKRKSNASLSAIRKRLRMQSSAYKSIEQLRRSQRATMITAAGNQALQVIGDGFDDIEFTSGRGRQVRKADSRKSRQRDYLFQGMQALTLVSGPMPDVEFASNTQGRLEFKVDRDQEVVKYHEGSSHAIDAPNVVPPSRQSGSRCARSVSFLDHDNHILRAQLCSISAPRREPSISLDTAEEDEDDGDDEAADTYVDEDDLQADDGASISDGDVRAELLSSPERSPEPGTPQSADSFRFSRRNSFTQRQNYHGVALDFHRLTAPGARLRSISRKLLTMELNEPMLDDFQVDDMLLEDPGCIEHTDNIADGPSSPIKSDRQGAAQPRSILKNSVPYVSSERNRPESTTANTRRNSHAVEVHESRYFPAATKRLDFIETSQPVIRKKSNSRYIEVPYSDDFVPETSPGKMDYSNSKQMHALRRNSEAVWMSKVVPSRQKDLGQLTRMVSDQN